MNSRSLEYLAALAKYNHFQHAADECNVTQSTLSIQLKKLEQELGAPLLDRSNKRVKFTTMGIRVVKQTHVILKELERLREMASKPHMYGIQNIRIGIMPSVSTNIFKYAVELCDNFPSKIELQFNEADPEKLFSMMKTGALECAIMDKQPRNSDFFECASFDEPLIIGVGARHQYALSESLEQAELKKLKILVPEYGNNLHDPIMSFCDQYGLFAEIGSVGMNIETLRWRISMSDYVSFFPYFSALDKNDTRLKYIRLNHFNPRRKIFFLSQREPVVKKFTELLIKKMTNALIE